VSIATEAPISSPSAAAFDSLPLESVAFSYLLDQHPRRLSVADLAREIGDGNQPALERAAANLADACLLARSGEKLVLSPAALRADRRH
jgi:hypothetical protein